MKKIILFSCVSVFIGTTHAAVYKCQSEEGVSYQDLPCSDYSRSKKIAITPIAPNVVKQARLRLEKRLKERKKLEQQRAEQQRKERLVRAMELKARAELEMAYEIQYLGRELVWAIAWNN